jgi:hypothetical protein
VLLDLIFNIRLFTFINFGFVKFVFLYLVTFDSHRLCEDHCYDHRDGREACQQCKPTRSKDAQQQNNKAAPPKAAFKKAKAAAKKPAAKSAAKKVVKKAAPKAAKKPAAKKAKAAAKK